MTKVPPDVQKKIAALTKEARDTAAAMFPAAGSPDEALYAFATLSEERQRLELGEKHPGASVFIAPEPAPPAEAPPAATKGEG